MSDAIESVCLNFLLSLPVRERAQHRDPPPGTTEVYLSKDISNTEHSNVQFSVYLLLVLRMTVSPHTSLQYQVSFSATISKRLPFHGLHCGNRGLGLELTSPPRVLQILVLQSHPANVAMMSGPALLFSLKDPLQRPQIFHHCTAT